MKKSAPFEGQKITRIPLDRYWKEGASQRDRIVKEVMDALFAQLPTDTKRAHDFILSTGTKCWVKKFHAPKQDAKGDWIYGFDVKFEDGYPLSHLEFSVNCSGWERVLSAPK